MSERIVPNVFLLGAAKAATTTLHSYLADMQDVCMSVPKEPVFFECEFEQGLAYYRQRYFAHWAGERHVGESRHRNLYLPYVPERIHQVNPDARLIVIVRNPIDRAYSHWWYWFARDKEKLSFAQAIREDYERVRRGDRYDSPEAYCSSVDASGFSAYQTYLDSGYYAEQIQRYLDVFPRSQLKILVFDDVVAAPYEVVTQLQEFLGIPSYKRSEFEARRENPSRSKQPRLLTKTVFGLYRIFGVRYWLPVQAKRLGKRLMSRAPGTVEIPPIDPETRAWLADHYAEHNQQLASLLRRDLSHWQ